MQNKKSIRFYKDHEVRAIWDEEKSLWWFSIVDIVGAITDSPSPRKYWSVLKTRLKKAGNELTTRCSQLKMTAADGKQYATDCFAQDDIIRIVRVIPSKKKAYTLLESGLLDDMIPGTVKSLQQIHSFLFGGLYEFAGKIRTKTISKGNTIFCLAEHLHQYLQTVEGMPDSTFDEIVDKYIEMNMAHPFMEGNGRSTRIWLDLMLKKRLGLCIDWSKIGKSDYLNAMIESEIDGKKIRELLHQALTDRIDDRETFMKGIDYSYYYEQEE